MSAIARHMVRSTASNLAGQLFVLATWFVLTPFVVHELGATKYGLWVLVASLVAYGDLLDLGVGAAVTKYVAELRPRGKSEEASALIATALWIYCAVGLLVIAASVPLTLVFPDLFHIAGPLRDDARWVVFLTGLALGVKLPAATAYAVLRGLQRFDLVNMISVCSTLVQAASTVAVLLLGWGVVGLAALVVPLTLLTQIPMQIVIRRVAPDLRLGWRGAHTRLVRTVASFSFALFVSNSAGVVKTKTDEIVIARALPLATVAPYSIARRLSELPTILTYQFVRLLLPLASELHGARQAERIRALYVASMRVTLALFVPVATALMILAGPFLDAWVGARYAGDADVAVILLGAAMLDMAMWPAASLLQGTNGHRLLAVFGSASALLNLGLSIALVRSVGVVGVALGTLIAAAVEVAVVVPFGMRRHGIPTATMVRGALLPGLLPAVPAVVVLFTLRAALAPSTLVSVIAVGAAGGLVYAGGYLSFPASALERTALWQLAVGAWQLARVRRLRCRRRAAHD
jgi:O-antigen/teichoic acid export membrane protein